MRGNSSKALVAPSIALAIGFACLALLYARWQPAAFATGYRFALFAALAPSLGSLIFTLIHRSTGGEWGLTLGRFLRPGVRLAPWIWLFGLPLLLIRSGFRSEPHGYESLPWIAARWAIVAGVLFAVTRLLATARPGGLVARENERSWIGPVGLLATVFTLTFVADDWIEGAHPGWHSTAFPVVWMAGQCAGALALAVLLGIRSGLRPSDRRLVGRELGNDWGNLLMASLIFWGYVSYGEFIIVWSGNKPDEISWFLTREASGWFYVMPVLFLGNLVIPFLLLLSRRFKRNARAMGRLCVGLLFGQVLYAAWLILPESQVSGVVILALDAALAALALALVAVAYQQGLSQREVRP